MASITVLAKMSPQQQTQKCKLKKTTKMDENQKNDTCHIRLQILKASNLNVTH